VTHRLRWVDAAGLDALPLAHPDYRDLLAGWLRPA